MMDKQQYFNSYSYNCSQSDTRGANPAVLEAVLGLGGVVIVGGGAFALSVYGINRLKYHLSSGFSPELKEALFGKNGCSQQDIEALQQWRNRFPSGSSEWRHYNEQMVLKQRQQQKIIANMEWIKSHVSGISFRHLTMEQQVEAFENLYKILGEHPSSQIDLRRMVTLAQKELRHIDVEVSFEKVRAENCGAYYSHVEKRVVVPDANRSFSVGSFFHEIMHGEQDLLKQMFQSKDATAALYMFAYEAEAIAVSNLYKPQIPAIYALKTLTQQQAQVCVQEYQHFLNTGQNTTNAHIFSNFLKNHAGDLPPLNEINAAFRWPSSDNAGLRNYVTTAFAEYRQRGYTMRLYLASSPEQRAACLNRLGIQITAADHQELDRWHKIYQQQAIGQGKIHNNVTYSQEIIEKMRTHFYERYGMRMPIEESMVDYNKALEIQHFNNAITRPVRYATRQRMAAFKRDCNEILGEYKAATEELKEVRTHAANALSGNVRGKKPSKRGKSTGSRCKRGFKAGGWGNTLLFLGTLLLGGTGTAVAIEMSDAQKVQKINALINELDRDTKQVKVEMPDLSSTDWIDMLQTVRADAQGEMANMLDVMIQATQQGKPIDFYEAAVQTGMIEKMPIDNPENPNLALLYQAQEAYMRAVMNKRFVETVQATAQAERESAPRREVVSDITENTCATLSANANRAEVGHAQAMNAFATPVLQQEDNLSLRLGKALFQGIGLMS